MSGRDQINCPPALETESPDGAEILHPPSQGVATSAGQPSLFNGVVIGKLVAIADEGRTLLVLYPGQPGTAALAARSVAELHGIHIGRSVVLMFEAGDATRPIVMGVLRTGTENALPARPGCVEVDIDGERMVVTAREQLVLRCGKASITLTRAGKVLIEGSYLLSKSTGVNRVKGGAIQLN